MLSSSCFRIPSPELSAAAVLETINTAVYAQQYVRYTKMRQSQQQQQQQQQQHHHHHRCYHCRSEAPQLALVELATLPRDRARYATAGL